MASTEQNVEKAKPEAEMTVVDDDSAEIMDLVGGERLFSSFAENKFKELDTDCVGELSVKELQPAIADLGAALGLPSLGSSLHSDLIYSEAMNEFTQGQREKVTKTKFKEVLLDILVGMAAGLKRDPIVILRIDGEDLQEFICSHRFDAEMVSIFSEIELPGRSLQDYIIMAFEKLTVDHGMPPCSDSWVSSNMVEPTLQSCANCDTERPISQEMFLVEFKKAAESLAQHLKEQPVIVAHTENTFNGSAIKRLLSNKFELDKTLDAAIEKVPKDRHKKISKKYLRVALDSVAASAGLPPYGAISEVDSVIEEALKRFNADDGMLVKADEFKKIITELLGSIMLQLEGNPISFSLNSVVHEPLVSSSTFLTPADTDLT